MVNHDTVFIGRAGELAQARAGLAALTAVALVGPAGVGQSTMASLVYQELAMLGRPGRRIAGREATRAIPFGAFGRLLGDRPPTSRRRGWSRRWGQGRHLRGRCCWSTTRTPWTSRAWASPNN